MTIEAFNRLIKLLEENNKLNKNTENTIYELMTTTQAGEGLLSIVRRSLLELESIRYEQEETNKLLKELIKCRLQYFDGVRP